MRLIDVPSGTTIFVDANCFVYHFAGTHPSCAVFFERARRRDLRAVTSLAVLGDVHHLASNDTDFLRVPNLTVWRP